MKRKSLNILQRIYFRLFKGAKVVDIGHSYKALHKASGGKYVDYSEGQLLSFKGEDNVIKKSKDKVEPASLESIQVAEFYHKVVVDLSCGEINAQYVAKELPAFRPYEIAEMVMDRLKGVNDRSQIREQIAALVEDFNRCADNYRAKRYGSRKYKTVPQND